MMRKFTYALFLLTLFFVFKIDVSFASFVGSDKHINFPLVITKNEGILHNSCSYFIRGGSSNLFFYPNKVTYQFIQDKNKQEINNKIQSHQLSALSASVELLNVDLEFEGANPSSVFEEEDALTSKTNYFIGSDQSAWRSGLSDFKTLVYKNIYKNIDVKYYGVPLDLEFYIKTSKGWKKM